MKYVDYIILKMNMLHIRQILNNADNRRDIRLSDDLYEKAGNDVQGLTSSKEKTRTSSLEYVRERNATSSQPPVRRTFQEIIEKKNVTKDSLLLLISMNNFVFYCLLFIFIFSLSMN